LKVALVAVIVVVLLTIGAPNVSAASGANFSGTSSAVRSAFIAVQAAGKDGGNITSLVVQLSGALGLVQKASAENASNPIQASTDLQSALRIAQAVQSSAGTVAQQGMSARQLQFELSVTSAAVIIGLAIALYLYGDKIYRRLWLRIYGSQMVRKVG
jgi:hypothetical protein